MKNISIVLLSLLIGSISVGCKKDFPSEESLINIYYENKELINSIKDGLFSSDFTPHDGMTESGYKSSMEKSIYLSYDYKNNQLFCDNDPQGEKLQSIQNVHSDIIEYFKRINRNGTSISFRKIQFSYRDDDTDIIIEFSLSGRGVGILYTNVPENWSGPAHIEDNWYALRQRGI